MAARIKSGDDVVVVGGKDRGKRGKVLRVEPKKDRLYVEGLNMGTERKEAALSVAHEAIDRISATPAPMPIAA